jgi:hypothetical protein
MQFPPFTSPSESNSLAPLFPGAESALGPAQAPTTLPEGDAAFGALFPDLGAALSPLAATTRPTIAFGAAPVTVEVWPALPPGPVTISNPELAPSSAAEVGAEHGSAPSDVDLPEGALAIEAEPLSSEDDDTIRSSTPTSNRPVARVRDPAMRSPWREAKTNEANDAPSTTPQPPMDGIVVVPPAAGLIPLLEVSLEPSREKPETSAECGVDAPVVEANGMPAPLEPMRSDAPVERRMQERLAPNPIRESTLHPESIERREPAGRGWRPTEGVDVAAPAESSEPPEPVQPQEPLRTFFPEGTGLAPRRAESVSKRFAAPASAAGPRPLSAPAAGSIGPENLRVMRLPIPSEWMRGDAPASPTNETATPVAGPIETFSDFPPPVRVSMPALAPRAMPGETPISSPNARVAGPLPSEPPLAPTAPITPTAPLAPTRTLVPIAATAPTISSVAAALGANERPTRPGAVVATVAARVTRGPQDMARSAANFAEVTPGDLPLTEIGSDDADKYFVTASKELLVRHSAAVGTDVANLPPTMSDRFLPALTQPAAFDYAALAGTSVAGLEAEGAQGATALADSPTPEVVNTAHRAVDVALRAVDSFASREQKSVDLQFSVGDAELNVRVELHADEVHTTFRTDSPDLRAALAQEWQSATSHSLPGEKNFRLAPATFVSADASALNASLSDASSRQREQKARREAGSPGVRSRTSLSPLSGAHLGTGRTSLRPLFHANSRHLHTLA